ncbi:hypothetical protein M2451_002918 [Dysgonomonas sp. PFB1-18]|nr:hypothetical protein [Dysgonomonas sp. PF1-14]MDH6339937.1 hypothetical protein [Dysgonomonas sp. PF1-16]MDH6381585.1 hypothetical protein [Dysgonomonas sp. PFB1-18]MDH6398778.1 hypothetical protein [Dysgonomonas sp. PF1-23]
MLKYTDNKDSKLAKTDWDLYDNYDKQVENGYYTVTESKI